MAMLHGRDQTTTRLSRLDDRDHLLGRRPDSAETFAGYGRTTVEDRGRTLALLQRLAAKMALYWHILSDDDRTNARIPAGYTYLGQLIAHDVSFNPAPLPRDHRQSGPMQNLSSRRLDLDCLYGAGPLKSPMLYQRRDGLPREKLRIGFTAPDTARGLCPAAADLPRVRVDTTSTVTDGNAEAAGCPYETLIADPRNEDVLILSQLVVLLIDLHNWIVDRIRESNRFPSESERVFGIARRATCEIYRSIVANDFLRAILAPPVWRAYCQKTSIGEFAFFGRDGGSPPPAALPVEFTVAAMRVGHAMVRPTYPFNRHHTKADVDLLMTFRPEALDRRVPVGSDWIIEWERFFPPMGETANGYAPIGDSVAVTPSQRLRPICTPAVFSGTAFQPPPGHLPEPQSGEFGLFYLDLARAYDLGLPSGQAMAKAFGLPQLGRDVLRRILGPQSSDPPHPLDARDIRTLADDTPLLYYLLAEAHEAADGRHLGPLGSSIVAEVLFGLLVQSRRPITAAVRLALADAFGDRPLPETMHDAIAVVRRTDPTAPMPA